MTSRWRVARATIDLHYSIARVYVDNIQHQTARTIDATWLKTQTRARCEAIANIEIKESRAMPIRCDDALIVFALQALPPDEIR